MRLKESSTVELKKSIAQLDDALKTICAFLNHKGGAVYFGVDNKGQILGTQVSEKTLRKISQQICSRIKPETIPEIREITENEKSLIEVKIPEGTNKPYFLDGKAYKKVGSEKRIIPPDELKKMILEQKTIKWDEEICKGATIKDINEEKMRQFLEKARSERRLDINPTISVKEALERLNLSEDNKMTNAAVLLFGKNPQKFFLQAETRCARFKGTEPLEFIDMKVFGETIIDQRDDAVEFVKEHIKLSAKIVGMERIERWEYSIEAVREAITNAICHRDYETTSNIQVRIFDNRIEFWGCGYLPKPLTVEDLKEKHRSIPRNHLIAENFFLIKYIEQWGTGTNRIIKECMSHGLPEPLFEMVGGDLVVTFRKTKLTEEYLENLPLNKRQQEVIRYLREHKKITSSEYSRLFAITGRMARTDLKELAEKRIIQKRGTSDKTTYYVLAEI